MKMTLPQQQRAAPPAWRRRVDECEFELGVAIVHRAGVVRVGRDDVRSVLRSMTLVSGSSFVEHEACVLRDLASIRKTLFGGERQSRWLDTASRQLLIQGRHMASCEVLRGGQPRRKLVADLGLKVMAATCREDGSNIVLLRVRFAASYSLQPPQSPIGAERLLTGRTEVPSPIVRPRQTDYGTVYPLQSSYVPPFQQQQQQQQPAPPAQQAQRHASLLRPHLIFHSRAVIQAEDGDERVEAATPPCDKPSAPMPEPVARSLLVYSVATNQPHLYPWKRRFDSIVFRQTFSDPSVLLGLSDVTGLPCWPNPADPCVGSDVIKADPNKIGITDTVWLPRKHAVTGDVVWVERSCLAETDNACFVYEVDRNKFPGLDNESIRRIASQLIPFDQALDIFTDTDLQFDEARAATSSAGQPRTPDMAVSLMCPNPPRAEIFAHEATSLSDILC